MVNKNINKLQQNEFPVILYLDANSNLDSHKSRVCKFIRECELIDTYYHSSNTNDHQGT